MADKPLQSLTIQGLSDTYVNTPLSIAPEFNPNTDYEYGDYVFYNRKLYKYIQDEHSAGPWNEDNFEEITVGSDIKELVNDTTVALINFSNAINDITNIGDDKVDKSAIDNAGITNITYETMFGGEFTVTTTATTFNEQTVFTGIVSVTGTIDKTKVYSVTMNGTEYIVPARLAIVNDMLAFYLGNIEMTAIDVGIIDETDNVPFFIGFLLSSQILSISTSEPGEYTFLIKQINYESKPIPRTLIYGDNYKPITVIHDDDNIASGFSIGVNKLTSADDTFAIGYGNEVGSYGGVAIGEDNIVNSMCSFAEGYGNIIENDNRDNGHSHIEGVNNQIYGINAHVEGANNYVDSKSFWSHIEGKGNKAYGRGCHVEGVENTAYIDGIHISGIGSYTEQPFPVWEQGGQEISYIYGVGSCVMHDGEPYICIEENDDATWDPSKWSLYPSNGRAAFVIGNGIETNSNAAMIDWSGNMYLGGDVYVGCDNTSNNGNKLLKENDILHYFDEFSGMVGYAIPAIIYSSEISYNQGFIGRYNNEYYICNVDGSQFTDPIDTSKWSKAENDIVLRMLSGAVVKSNVIADPYINDNQISYNVDDVVLYNNRLYACNEDGVSGEFDSSKWTEMTVGACLANLNQAIVTLDDDLNHKANKVLNATSGNFASLDANGNLVDSGHKHSDYLTEAPVTDVQIDGTSIISDGVANIPTPVWPNPGVVKVSPDYGIKTLNNGTIATATPSDTLIKEGTNQYRPIVPLIQHKSTFYGLAKAAGDSTQSASNNAVGVYTDGAKTAIQTMLDVPSNSDLVDYVKNTDYATSSVGGVVKVDGDSGTGMHTNGRLRIIASTSANIKAGTQIYRPIVPYYQHESVFYGLAKAAGDTTQSVSENAVGTYTDEAKVAIKTMLGVQDSTQTIVVSGTTPTITALTNTRYICGEVSTLTITPPGAGICEVVFTSGSTPTVLTATGVTFPSWFDSSALEANTTYEISIADGKGVVCTWAS